MSDAISNTMSSTISNTAQATGTWVAVGPAGAIGSIHATSEGYAFRLRGEEVRATSYPTLEIAKRALAATQPVGSEWPEFHQH